MYVSYVNSSISVKVSMFSLDVGGAYEQRSESSRQIMQISQFSLSFLSLSFKPSMFHYQLLDMFSFFFFFLLYVFMDHGVV